MTSIFLWIEERLDNGMWFRRGLAVTTVWLTFSLTNWAAQYAEKALATKAALLDVAAVITAVAGIPLALLTLLFNKYIDGRGA